MNELDRVTDNYIVVDVEAAGPYPGRYSLLSLGACTLSGARESFYVELKPVNRHFLPQAVAVSGLSLERLRREGADPAAAMRGFADWLEAVVPGGKQPLFVAFNAPFDWMFVAHYFLKFLGHNPFGHAALDVKSFYMGLAGVSWEETSMRYVGPRYLTRAQLSHNARQDALDEAEIFRKMLEQAGGKWR